MVPFADVFHLLLDDVVVDAMLEGVVGPCDSLAQEASIVWALSYMGFLEELTPRQAWRLSRIGAELDAGVRLVPLDPARRARLLALLAAARQAVIRDFELDEDELPRVAGSPPAVSLN
jgi:hypothetical protein